VSIPIGTVPVPDVVSRIAVGRPVHPTWANEIGGLTFQIGDGIGREFVKVAPPHPEIDLLREAAKLRWAASYLVVPEVLGVGRDGPLEWLHTAGLPGRSAVDPHWIARPREAVRAIATGLRADARPAARRFLSLQLVGAQPSRGPVRSRQARAT
jgi:kanamycin kinase